MSVGNIIVWIVWIAAAAACIGSALAVVALRNALYSALALIGNLISLAVFYLLLSAEFVAYVGWDKDIAWTGGPRWQTLGSVVAAAALLCELVVVIVLGAANDLKHTDHVSANFGSASSVGRVFMSNHLLAFEVISIVLLVAAIGGVILGAQKQRRRSGGLR